MSKSDRQLDRAKRIEDALRERAFLPIGEVINGVEVLQLTLRHLTILFHIRSPFLHGTPIGIEDVGMFLWLVSPHYAPVIGKIKLPRYRRAWMKLRRVEIPTVREAFMAQLVRHPRWDLFYRAITRYLDRAFMDRPPVASGGKPIGASYAAAMIHRIAISYGWSKEEILDTPVAALFQMLKWIAVERDPKTPQFNPIQDRIKQRMLSDG